MLDKILFRLADGGDGGEVSYYSAETPSGKRVLITPGEVAMKGDKGLKKFKPESLAPTKFSEKVDDKNIENTNEEIINFIEQQIKSRPNMPFIIFFMLLLKFSKFYESMSTFNLNLQHR